MVVFDAGTGHAVSFNREARRIAEVLRTPGRAPEQLLEVISCRRADGREVSLAELPLAQQFGSAETVRAEEMVLSVPDGRSVATLVNATPIHAEDGTVPLSSMRWCSRASASRREFDSNSSSVWAGVSKGSRVSAK